MEERAKENRRERKEVYTAEKPTYNNQNLGNSKCYILVPENKILKVELC